VFDFKVRLQSLNYQTALQCTRKTLNTESVSGFYKGMLFPFLSAGVLHSLYFGAYGATIRALSPDEWRLLETAAISERIPYSHVHNKIKSCVR